MREQSPPERIAALETADRYERNQLELMQKTIDSLREELDDLKEWKRNCDNMSKIWLRVAMTLSLIATSIGVWLDNIKSLGKHILAWIVS
jgi:hypothetical protein